MDAELFVDVQPVQTDLLSSTDKSFIIGKTVFTQ